MVTAWWERTVARRCSKSYNDKEKSKKVIRLWKSGKVYPEEFLNSIEQIMDRTGAPTNNEDVNMVNEIRLI